MRPSRFRFSSAPLLLIVFLSASAWGQAPASSSELDTVFGDARAFYLDLHQSPELSGHEVQTASKLAGRLRSLGYAVTEHVGGTGIVALLANGPGPTIMLRTELDALPVEEKTGLPYASKVRVKDDSGQEVGVMHACGHDLHMASLFAAAAIMAHSRDTWHGTLMLIGQPSEEAISGARRMLADGFLTRFPKPDIGIALHVFNELPAGKVGVGSGYRYSNADSLRITLYGQGGHGSRPDTTVDPVVLAARTVVALQTIVAREIKPGETAVVTVGYLHAGTKNNIISDQAEMGLSIRSYKPEVRHKLLTAITRITQAEAAAAGAPREPLIEHLETTDAVYNDPALARRLQQVLESKLGQDNTVSVGPSLASEDYSCFVEAGIPSFYFVLGGAEPGKFAQAQASGQALPSNHSPLFAPDLDPALRTGIRAEVAVLRDLLNASAADLHRLTQPEASSNR